MRRFFLCLLAFGVLVAVSLVILPSFVSSDWMRAELARQLSGATGSTIALNGPVRLSVVPHLAVVAENVALEADGVTARIDAVAGSVTVSSLWSERLHIREVRLTRPVVTIRQSADSVEDSVEDVIAQSESGGETQPKVADPLAALVAFLERSAIDSVSIDKGILEKEDATGATQIASDLDLTLAVPDIDGELSLSAGAGVEGRRYELTLAVSPLRPLLERKPAELDISLKTDPVLAPGLDEVKANGQVALNANGSYQIRGGKLLLGEEALGLDALYVPGSRPRFLADLSADRLDIGAFSATGSSTASQSAGQSETTTKPASAGIEALAGFDADISVNVGALTLGEISASDVALTATLKDGLFTGKLAHLGIDAGGLSADIETDVRKSPPTFQGRIVSNGLDIAKLANLAGQSVPLTGTLTTDTGFAFRGVDTASLRQTINVAGVANLQNATLIVPGIADASMSEVRTKKLAIKVDGLGKPARLAGDIAWRGKSATVDLQTPLPDLISAAGSGTGDIPLTLALRMKEAALALEGKLALTGGYAGKVNFSTPDLGALLAWAGQGGGDSIDQFAFNGNLSARPDGISFDNAALSVNGVEANGSGAVELGSPLKISSALRFAELDLARLAGAPSAAPRSNAKAKAGNGPVADAPLDLSSLRSIEASIKVDAEKLGYGRVFAGPVATTLVVSGGVANLDLPESPFYGGKAAASLRADGSGSEPSITVKASISGASSAPLLADLANFKHLEGALEAKFDIAGAGGTTGALKRSLQGTANVRFSDGAIRGIDVADVYNNLVGLMSSGFKQNDNTATGFTELGASFAIENGIARTDDIKMIGPLVRMSGSGQANIPDDQLNFRLDPRVVASLQGQGGDIATEGIGVPVVIEGSFAAPRIYPDLSGLLKDPDAALSALKKFGLPTDKLKLDELLSKGGKSGALRDIIGGALGKPPKADDGAVSIEQIIGGKGAEAGEAPPPQPADEQTSPDTATEQQPPEAAEQDQQPQADQPKEEGGALGKLFNQILQ
ncbi:AsmA family protein [Ensifer sp.]|jgi:AsmA protein|uniref:AsmA family protein n=1 Tax=Ensifer sp. TaxID=1872086 RepID=UPI002E10B6EC|nr:AsmA family protein [Ensifer sp.]